MIFTPKGMELMIGISKEHPNQTSPVERALRFHADSKCLHLSFNFCCFRKRIESNKRELALARDDGGQRMHRQCLVVIKQSSDMRKRW